MVLLCQVARNILTEFSPAIVCDVKINQWKYSLHCHVDYTLSNKMDTVQHNITKASMVYNALREN